MSASMRPTRWPARASATARFAETVDFPTPPLPDEMATTFPRCGSSTGVGGGGTAPDAARGAPCPALTRPCAALASATLTAVRVNVADASAAQGRVSAGQGAPRAASGAVPPPPTPVELPHLGKALAVSSGKGGVGKSTVSANLAVALARAGHRVGLMDADIYGPNIPRMLGVDQKPEVVGGKIQPLESHGVKLMSLGFIVEREAPAIWRGPIIMKIIQQFLRDVAWGELDYFIVDLPPGTGDAQLSLVQTIHLHGAVIVTTPQEVAVGDSLRGAKMFEKVGVRVLGIVENMSYYICPHCGDRSELFLSGGGERLAGELGIPLLGQIPLQ